MYIEELGFNPPTITAQQKGVRVMYGKPVFYTKPEVKRAKQELAYHLKKYAPKEPLQGALMCSVYWYFKTEDKKRDGKLRDTKPDLDNLQKLLQDLLSDLGFYKNDAQIVELHITKFWRHDLKDCGIEIYLGEIKGGAKNG